MKRLFSVIFIISALLPMQAQNDGDFYRVQFKSKPHSAYQLDHPHSFLSERAIKRRKRQSIKISTADLPIPTLWTSEVRSLVSKASPASKWLNEMGVRATQDQVLALLELPFIASVEPINPGGLKTQTDVNAPHKIYGLTESQLNQINLDKGPHRNYAYGEDMLIAVLDAGFSGANTVQFSEDFKLFSTKNFVSGGSDVYTGNGSHGFSVLSTMAGNLDGVYVGSAPNAGYALVTTEDIWSETPLEMYNWVAGAEYADSIGADIINSSLGYYEFDDPSDSYTTDDLDGKTSIITLGALEAARRGILVVTSAGNAGGGSWDKITFPADADSVLTVGAVNEQGIAASFTSKGYTTDGRVKPNVSARGVNAAVYRSDGELQYANGTSFSSPIMAGAAACLWQSVPEATAQEVIKALEVSSSHYYQHNKRIGYGIPNLAFAERYLKTTVGSAIPEVVIYPNPFPDYIQLFLPDSEVADIKLELRDLYSRTVIESVLVGKRYQAIWAPGDHIPAGTYFLFIERGEYQGIQRVIKLQ